MSERGTIIWWGSSHIKDPWASNLYASNWQLIGLCEKYCQDGILNIIGSFLQNNIKGVI